MTSSSPKTPSTEERKEPVSRIDFSKLIDRERLDISTTPLTTADIPALFQFLEHNPNINQIYCGQGSTWAFDKDCMIAFMKELSRNKTIKIFYINRESPLNDPEVATAVAAMLKANNTLTELTLWPKLSDKTAAILADGLKDNKALLSLILSGGTDKQGVIAFANALMENKKLQYLFLSHSTISDAAADTLARTITLNHALTALHLEECKLSQNGIIALAKALASNKFLRWVNLVDLTFEPDTWKEIVKMLKLNSTINSLSLINYQYQKSWVNDDVIRDLAEILKINSNLTHLVLPPPRSSLEDSVKTLLCQAMKKNTSIVSLGHLGTESPEITAYCMRNRKEKEREALSAPARAAAVLGKDVNAIIQVTPIIQSFLTFKPGKPEDIRKEARKMVDRDEKKAQERKGKGSDQKR